MGSTVQTASHQGLGSVNQNLPVFDMGAFLYWNSAMGERIQSKGGLMPVTYTYSGTDNYTYWHPGRGKFVEVDPGAAAVIPRDGHFAPARSNVYVASDATGERGFTRQSGLTAILDSSSPTLAGWILDPVGGLTEALIVTNTSGTVKRMWHLAPNEPSGANTRFKIWSILVRRSDGADIDSSTLTLGLSLNAAGPLGADASSGSTAYQKIRSDGWHIVWIRSPEIAPDQDLYYWAEIADGAILEVEAPQVEGLSGEIEVNAGASQEDIVEPSPPVLTQAGDPSTGRERTAHGMVLDETYRIPPSGWMACSVLPRSDYADHVSSSEGVPNSTLFEWRIPGAGPSSLLSGLLAYWKLDESSGSTRVDSTANGEDLAESGSVASHAGLVSNAASFSASGVYLQHASSTFFNLGVHADWSVLVWVYLDNKSSSYTFVSKDNSGVSRQFHIRYSSGPDRLTLAYSSDGSSLSTLHADTLGSPSATTWYLIHAYHDGVNDELGISVNGGSYDTVSHSAGIFQSTEQFAVGCHFSSGSPVNQAVGDVDEMAVYDRVLTPSEVSDYYNSGSGTTHPFGGGGGGTTGGMKFHITTAEDAVVFEINTGGESSAQVFAELQPSDLTEGAPLGLAATWGYRNGVFSALLCLNGSVVELDTASPDGMPSADGGQIAIGRSVAAADPPTVNVQQVAIGNRALSHHDVRVLSRWCQKSSVPTIGANAI